MNQRDGFAGGFLAGAIFGGVVGGVLGALLAVQRDGESVAEEEPKLNPTPREPKKVSAKRRQMKASEGESIEIARRSLEDKIAQLNATIDEVRQQLGNVNGSSIETSTERLRSSSVSEVPPKETGG